MTKRTKSIAEYAIRKWLTNENFAMECFELIMTGNAGTLSDQSGNSMVLVYDPDTRSVHVEGD